MPIKDSKQNKTSNGEKYSTRISLYILDKCLSYFPRLFRIRKREYDIVPDFDFYLDGVLIGLAVVSVLTILTLDDVSKTIYISTILFSISIPSLAFAYVTYITANKYQDREIFINASKHLESLGQLTAILGFSFIFFNISFLAGILFLVTGALGLILYFIIVLIIIINDDNLLKKYNNEEKWTPETYKQILVVRKLLPFFLDSMEDVKKEKNKDINTEVKKDE